MNLSENEFVFFVCLHVILADGHLSDSEVQELFDLLEPDFFSSNNKDGNLWVARVYKVYISLNLVQREDEIKKGIATFFSDQDRFNSLFKRVERLIHADEMVHPREKAVLDLLNDCKPQ